MKKHTSIRIGGPAEVLIIPQDESDLHRILLFADKASIPVTIMGNGTKLLVGDDGIPGIVVKITEGFDTVRISGDHVWAGAGCPLPRLSNLVAEEGLSGLEFSIGIPGTVGAAIIMNAGAHGHEIGDVVISVKAMRLNGEIYNKSKKELKFGYRESILQTSTSIVLSVELLLVPGDSLEIRDIMTEYLRWRRENQPQDLPNAGSIFKNPPGLVAGKLIDEAGLKGMIIGGAKISEKRANFFQNTGNATASDIFKLMKLSQEKVLDKYGIELVPEIQVMGVKNA
jgi:UDP-N-acetylmuramate dehydrogenase